jgi:predicted aspartyl protease
VPDIGRRIPALAGLLLLLAACQQGSGCALVKVAQLPLEESDKVFLVPLTLNGHTLKMLLDTGAQKTMLDAGAVRRLGIPQDGRTFSIMVGIGGGSPVADANVQGLLLGGVPVGIDRMPVSTFDGASGASGVLGLDILRDYDLDIDGPNRTLTLYRVRRCERADPPWNQAGVPVEGVGTRIGWMEIPIEIDGVMGTGAVDTGASYTTIMPRMARRLGLTERAMAGDETVQVHVVAGADAEARIHRAETIKVGPALGHGVPILVLGKEPPALGGGQQFGDAVVGQDVLGARRVWFSLATGRLFMSRLDGGATAR